MSDYFTGNSDAPGSLRFGYFYGGVFFDGFLDDVRIYNRALSPSEAKKLYQYESTPQRLTDGLVGFYPFNGNANDESGNGNNGSVFGAALTTDRFGNPSSAFSFNGVTDYIGIPDAPSLNPPSSISVSAWIKSAEARAGCGIVSKWGADDTAIGQWVLEEGNNPTSLNPGFSAHAVFAPAVHPQTGLRVDYASPQVDGLWHHLMMTYDGTILNLYRDGKVVATKSGGNGTLAIYAQAVEIGRYYHGVVRDGRSYNFSGLIDDVRIYNRQLSSSEVQQLYAYESQPPYQPVAIIQQPQGQTVNPGSTVTLGVMATGTAPITYAWKFNGKPIGGATASTLVLNAITSANAGSYTVDVSNVAGTVSSAAAVVAVNTPTTIVQQPQSVSVNPGTTVTLSVTAAGTAPLTYQWSFKGIPIAGATSASLTLTKVNSANSGSYTVDVSNVVGTVTSAPAVLVVNTPVSIVQQPQSTTAVAGSDVTLQVTATGTAPLTYAWKFNGSPIAGATSATLTLKAVTSASAGNYTVEISNIVGPVTSAPALLTVVFPPSIVQQPADLTVFSGDQAKFSVQATGTEPLSYQWFRDGAAIPGATQASLIIPNAFFSDAGGYTVLASNPYGTQTSTTATLSVKAVPNFVIHDQTPGGGIVLLDPFNSSFPPNSKVTLTAKPNAGWTFLDWKGNAEGTNPVVQIVTTYDKTVRARFGTALSLQPSANGSVTVDPEAALYPYGMPVRITATPQDGSYFAGWSGSVAGDVNPLTVPVRDANATIAASFRPLPAGKVSLLVVSEGNGKVSVNPRANLYSAGQSITNTALPDPGQEFLGWSGDAQGLENPLVVTMDRSKRITARFTERPQLDLQRSGKDGLLLNLTGKFTGAYQLLGSQDLVNWSGMLSLTNAYGEAQVMDPAGSSVSCFTAIELGQPRRTATAVPTVINGFLIAVTVTDGGQGYVTPPQVTISGGGGSGALATATIVDGKVDKVIVISAGSGYMQPPTVIIAAPGL